MDPHDIVLHLQKAGLLSSDDVKIETLQGGVSSDIHLVRDGKNSFVIKRALPKLRVVDDWYADVSRNQVEQAYIQYAEKLIPGSVPAILHSDRNLGFFVMEYFGDEYLNWKDLLLRNDVNPQHAKEAARFLGRVHSHSWHNDQVRRNFDTTQNFFALRIEPYLLATAKKHAPLAVYYEKEAERIKETRICLVHGDFSPKNILIGPDRMIVLDCEVAWYGEPAFDLAFMMNHFLLKSLHFAPNGESYLDLIDDFWGTYCNALSDEHDIDDLESRVAHLLPMLYLARIDGKSQAEYITDGYKKDIVRRFVTQLLPLHELRLADLVGEWRAELRSHEKHWKEY